jgi:hypothetical protein
MNKSYFVPTNNVDEKIITSQKGHPTHAQLQYN